LDRTQATGTVHIKQGNRDGREDSRSIGNKRYETERTPKRNSNDQNKQSKNRQELDHTSNTDKELNTHTDSRPKLKGNYRRTRKHSKQEIWGAHQQASEWAAPPVSVEEKGKTTGEKRKLLLFLLMSIQNLN
jgi:hypothetical protein